MIAKLLFNTFQYKNEEKPRSDQAKREWKTFHWFAQKMTFVIFCSI